MPPTGAGDPKALVSSLSHAREFLPLDGSIRAKKCLWETSRERRRSSRETFLSGSREVCTSAEDVQVQLICVCTIPATDASLAALFHARWSLPAPQNGVPCNILHLPLFP